MVFVEIAKKTSRAWAVTAGMLAAVLLAVAPGTAYAQSQRSGPSEPSSPPPAPRGSRCR